MNSSPQKLTGADGLALVFGLVMLLFLSSVPALLGPMMAPRAMELFSPVICSEGATSGRVVVTARRARRGTSYNWHYQCRHGEGLGYELQVDGFRAFGFAWLLHSGSMGLSMLVAVTVLNALDRAAKRGRRA